MSKEMAKGYLILRERVSKCKEETNGRQRNY